MDFKPVEKNDREAITAYSLSSYPMICDYSFSNLYSWAPYYKTSWAVINDHLVIRFLREGRDHPIYLFPLAPGPYRVKETIETLGHHSYEHGYELTIMSVCPNCRKALETEFPDRFDFSSDRDWFDYIYLRESLATLSGKKLQSKRNHVNRFIAQYPDYQYEEINDTNASECLELLEVWRDEKDEEGISGIDSEIAMIKRAMDARKEIGILGGAIRVDGNIIAFSMGTPISHETFGVSIEKADTSFPGAFNIINREFARHIPEQYTFVNREEDMGLEGLRKAKLSYKPTFLLEKETAVLRNK